MDYRVWKAASWTAGQNEKRYVKLPDDTDRFLILIACGAALAQPITAKVAIPLLAADKTIPEPAAVAAANLFAPPSPAFPAMQNDTAFQVTLGARYIEFDPGGAPGQTVDLYVRALPPTSM